MIMQKRHQTVNEQLSDLPCSLLEAKPNALVLADYGLWLCVCNLSDLWSSIYPANCKSWPLEVVPGSIAYPDLIWGAFQQPQRL